MFRRTMRLDSIKKSFIREELADPPTEPEEVRLMIRFTV